MLKRSIRIPLIFLIALITWQLLFEKNIRWLWNIGLCISIFLAYLFWEWAKKPYNWKKDE